MEECKHKERYAHVITETVPVGGEFNLVKHEMYLETICMDCGLRKRVDIINENNTHKDN